jgi:hypothetical protein
MELAKLEEEEEEQEAIAALRGVKKNIRATRTMNQRDLLTRTQAGGKSPKRIVKHGQKVTVLDEGAIKERTVSTFVERDSQIVEK